MKHPTQAAVLIEYEIMVIYDGFGERSVVHNGLGE